MAEQLRSLDEMEYKSMNKNEQMEFVKHCFECLYDWYEEQDSVYGESKRISELEPEDGGVPADMEAGEPDEEAYVKWKLIPSTLTDTDIDALEQEFGVTFPGLYRACLTAYFHLFGDSGEFPSQPSDNPLEEVRSLYFDSLIACGYLPFARDEDDEVCYCIDLRHMPDEEHCQVCRIDFETYEELEDSEEVSRAELEAEMETAYANLEAYLRDNFIGEE